MPSAYLIPTAGRFGRGESRKENRRTEAEICLQRHRRDGRGEESTTTPDEGSERKGVSRAQGGGEREEPRRRISRRHSTSELRRLRRRRRPLVFPGNMEE